MYILPLAALALLAACSKTPRGVLPPEKMASLLADVYRGESVIEYNRELYRTDSLKKVVKQSVYAAHGVDQAMFDSSMVWYGHNVEEYVKVCDRAVELLEADLAAVPDDPRGLNQMLVFGDSAQVWPLSPYYHISAATPARYIVFNLTPDDNWEPGDEYTLEFKSYNTRTPVRSALAAEYADGGVTFINHSLDNDGREHMILRLDTARQATSVYGYIKLDPQASEHIYLDSLSLIRTRFNNTLPLRRTGAQQTFNRGLDL